MKTKRNAKPHPQPVDALVYPRFSDVPTFMRLPHIPRADEMDIAVTSIPFDGGTTYRPGPRFGPRNMRVQSAMIRPWNPILEVSPFTKWRIAYAWGHNRNIGAPLPLY
jgi:arginase family enzyme